MEKKQQRRKIVTPYQLAIVVLIDEFQSQLRLPESLGNFQLRYQMAVVLYDLIQRIDTPLSSMCQELKDRNFSSDFISKFQTRYFFVFFCFVLK